MSTIKIISAIIKVIIFVLSCYFCFRFVYAFTKFFNLDYKKEAEKRKYYFKEFIKYFIIEVVYGFMIIKLTTNIENKGGSYKGLKYSGEYGDIYLIISFVYIAAAFLFWYFIMHKDILKRMTLLSKRTRVALSLVYFVGISIVLFVIIRFSFIQ